MMKQHYIKLFQYELWANQRIIDALEETKYPDERGLELLSHILAAQNNWLINVRKENSYVLLWEKKDLFECSQLLKNCTQGWINLINSLEEKDLTEHKKFESKAIEEGFHSTLSDVMMHVINHSTYHRGQIVSALKGKIKTLPETDYFQYILETQQV
jgi:uncharacterized damage-inducible protein DinB